jgi:hypothetical protein
MKIAGIGETDDMEATEAIKYLRVEKERLDKLGVKSRVVWDCCAGPKLIVEPDTQEYLSSIMRLRDGNYSWSREENRLRLEAQMPEVVEDLMMQLDKLATREKQAKFLSIYILKVYDEGRADGHAEANHVEDMGK